MKGGLEVQERFSHPSPSPGRAFLAFPSFALPGFPPRRGKHGFPVGVRVQVRAQRSKGVSAPCQHRHSAAAPCPGFPWSDGKRGEPRQAPAAAAAPPASQPVDFGSWRLEALPELWDLWKLARRANTAPGKLPRVQRRGFYYYDVYSFPGSVSLCQGRRGRSC